MKTVTLKLEDDEWSDLRIAAFKERQPFGAYLISRIRSVRAKPKAESHVHQPEPETTSRVHPMDPQSVEQILGKANEKAEPVQRKSAPALEPESRKGVDIAMTVPSILPDNTAEEVKSKMDQVMAKKKKADELARMEKANEDMKKRGYGAKK